MKSTGNECKKETDNLISEQFMSIIHEMARRTKLEMILEMIFWGLVFASLVIVAFWLEWEILSKMLWSPAWKVITIIFLLVIQLLIVEAMKKVLPAGVKAYQSVTIFTESLQQLLKEIGL